ncbi:isocitrate lyase/PEP mutase family protein [Alphaproteobacteria bacterium]|jgi:2-methylisocitrate lyase-like PEP mutase family enzyme|nr:isocitrate lyase/PEP mutase family protein [Alphaproteobacteria bacterium]
MAKPAGMTEFAQNLRSGNTQFVAGCYDAMSALLAEKAGFNGLMSSGFAVSAAHLGFPDVELYTMTENLTVVRNITGAVSVPVVADTDTGYGNAINVMRTVREFENAGVAAMIFEDQLSPKKCAACANRIELIPPDEAVAKIRAAVEARSNPDTLIIARTDEVDENAAIARAKLYVKAGADLIQPISRCFKDIDGLRRLRAACGVPLSLQILGWLESDLSADEIREVAGLACYPLVGLMSAAKVLQENFSALAQDLNTANLPQPKMSMDEFKSFIGFDEIEREQERFLLTE